MAARKQKVRLTGVREVNQNIRKLERNLKRDGRKAITSAASFIMRESMELTPVDTSNLKNSHRIKIRRTSKGWQGAIWVTAEYALYVHEADKDVNFQSPPPKGRKFLDRAISENIPEIIRRIKKALKLT